MIDLVSPYPATSQPHQNADTSNNPSLKSISSMKIPPTFLYTNYSFSNTNICAQFIEELKAVSQSMTLQ